MNKVTKATALSLLIALGLPAASMQMAHAANDTSGTVNFTGKVLANTCTLTSKDVSVDMGFVLTDQFTQAGNTGPNKDVDIKLTGCDAELQGATVKFTGTADTTAPDDLALTVGTDTAKGIAIELDDEDGKKVALNGDPSKEYSLKGGGDKTLHFTAHYVSTADAVSAGHADANANFDLTYR